jgi:SNF2 family DNA or RNA helicase
VDDAKDDSDYAPKDRSPSHSSSIEDNEVTKEQKDEVEADEEEEEEEEEEDDDDNDDDDDEGDGVLEGLKVTLLPHQIDGVRWMCDKETGRKTTKGIFPKGGILADDMGLGKTVQAIALILRNRKSDHEHSDDTNETEGKTTKLPPNCSSSTLVIAPLALIKQWESEIKDKVEKTHKLSVCVYHGATRAKTSKNLNDYDIVITTYGTLTSDFNSSATDKAKKAGLFSIHWYRIILDEAHTIKNRNAKATQSAYALDAQYRWCLSGTPLQNNLDELQSLIKFLRVKPYDDLAAWRDQISRPLANGRGGLAIQRLQVYLKAFMKRRTKDVLKLNNDVKEGEEGEDGKPKKSNGFHITKREVIKVAPEFMPGELNFYKRLEQRTENSLEQMMGGAKVDYAGALVLLLRLRQCCNHPDLVKGDLAKDRDILLQTNPTASQSSQPKSDDLDSMAELFGAMSVVNKKCDVCQTELSQGEAKAGNNRCGECEADLNTNIIGTDKKKKKKKTEKTEKSHKKKNVPDSPSLRRSEAQLARSRKNRRVVLDSDDEEEDGDWVVPEDQRKMPSLGKAGGSDDENAEGGGEWLNSEDETDDEIESPSRRKSKPIILSDSEAEESDSDEEHTEEGENGELPSTKIRHLMKILNREAPDFKFIVFSVFTSMLDKIEPFLNSANIGFARYDGGMANNHREASLEKLRNHSGTRVLLCSLRAGALGLNLTAASRVVILEPFWNPVSHPVPPLGYKLQC